jgi:hypothetical protein
MIQRLCILYTIRETDVKLFTMYKSGSSVVKALYYKTEGRGSDTRWGDF